MELKIGDRIYPNKYGTIGAIEEVTKVTKAHAFTKSGTKFLRLIEDNGYCTMIGGGVWSPSFWIENEELKAQLKKGNLSYKLGRLDFSKLSLDKLIKIDEILNDN